MTAFTIYPPTPQGFEDMTEEIKEAGLEEAQEEAELTEKEKDEQGEQDILDESKVVKYNEPYKNQ